MHSSVFATMLEVGSSQDASALAEVTLVESSDVLEAILPYIEGRELGIDLEQEGYWEIVCAVIKYEVSRLL